MLQWVVISQFIENLQGIYFLLYYVLKLIMSLNYLGDKDDKYETLRGLKNDIQWYYFGVTIIDLYVK